MKKKILIVDDSPTIVAQMVADLGDEFDCLIAANGAEGFQRARMELPDAMIVDLEMPEVDGIRLLEWLKADDATRAVPVVIATTVTSVDKMNQCRALGCSGFVIKPVQVDYLKAKLRQLTSARPAKAP